MPAVCRMAAVTLHRTAHITDHDQGAAFQLGPLPGKFQGLAAVAQVPAEGASHIQAIAAPGLSFAPGAALLQAPGHRPHQPLHLGQLGRGQSGKIFLPQNLLRAVGIDGRRLRFACLLLGAKAIIQPPVEAHFLC